MAKVLAARGAVCAEHPHRDAADRCDECRRLFCAECLVRGAPRLRCRSCSAAAADGAAELWRRRRVGYRLARAGRQVRAQGRRVLAAGVIAAFVAAASWGVWRGAAALGAAPGGRGAGGAPVAAELPGIAERIAVEQYCTGGGETLTALREADYSGTAGTLLTDSGAYAAAVAGPLAPLGGETAATPTPAGSFAGEAALHDPRNLVRSQGAHSPGWRSASSVLPQQVGFALRQTVALDRVAFWQAVTAPPESWARDVTLLVSTAAPDRQYRVAGRWTLGSMADVQTFSFVAVRARYVRLCLQSRHGGAGNADFVSLGGFTLGVLTGTVIPDGRPVGPLPLSRQGPIG